MYQCEKCNRTVPPRTKANRLVAKTRLKHYPGRLTEKYRKRGNVIKIEHNPGTGREIVREVTVCPMCADRCHTPSPRERTASRQPA
ncbi:MAG: hypothetical protein AAFR56_07560, partial [Chloroflexota bacterium]